MSEYGKYEFSGGFDRLIPKVILPVGTPKPAPEYDPPTCAEATHGAHEACGHVWEWLGQAARDKDSLSELAHDRAHSIERLEREKANLLDALEYIRQVTAGERSDDFSDDEEPIIAMNLRAREALAACGGEGE